MSLTPARQFPSSTRPCGRGFTLIEALVTIFVLVITLPILVNGFAIGSNLAIRTRQKAEATAIAQSVMGELLATAEWQNGGYNAQETHRNTTYTVTSSLVDWEETSLQQLNDVQRLDVTVTWTYANVQEQIVLSTVVYQPDGSLLSPTAGATQ